MYGYGAGTTGFSAGCCSPVVQPIACCPTVAPAAGCGIGVGIIAIAVLILIALGVIF